MEMKDQEFLRRAGYVAGLQTVFICILLPVTFYLAVQLYMKK